MCCLQGPQSPETLDATPIEALQNTQAEGDSLAHYWAATGTAGDAAGMVLFEALQAEQGRAWRAVAERHLRRRQGQAVSSAMPGQPWSLQSSSCCLLPAAWSLHLWFVTYVKHWQMGLEAEGSYLARCAMLSIAVSCGDHLLGLGC